MLKNLFVFSLINLSLMSNCFAASLYCGKHIVAIGDSAYDVLMKCEKPEWKDNIKVEVINEIARGKWKKTTLNRETWLYNFGPNSFMRQLVFENDTLVEIKSLGYGYLEKDIGRFGNIDTKSYMEMSKPEVLIHWGEPDYKTKIAEERFYKVNEKNILKYSVTISKWIYNFGPRRFMKTLIFENDKLINIESGKYGYEK